MDAAHLTQMFLLAGAGAFVGRFVLTSLERAGEGVTGAFTTGSTQSEWRRPSMGGWDRALERDAIDESIPGIPAVTRAGSFVVQVRRVAPIRYRRLPI